LTFRREVFYVVESGPSVNRLVMYLPGDYRASREYCAGHIADSRSGSLEQAKIACSTAPNCTRFDYTIQPPAYRLRTDDSDAVECEEWVRYDWRRTEKMSSPIVLEANLSRPHASYFDEKLGLLIADTGHGRILRVRPSAVEAETIVSGFRAPTSAIAAGENLYISDGGARQVYQWPLSACEGDLHQCWQVRITG